MIAQNKIIIAFSGKKGVGKTSAAAYLAKQHGFKMVAFADYLKELSAQLFPFDLDNLHGFSKETTFKNYSWTPREFMVKFGQFMRYWDKNYWIRNVDIDATLQNVALHDLRYKNEADYLKLNGVKLVRIERYKKDNPYHVESNDESETQLDNYDFDFAIPEVANSSLETLYKSLDYMLEKFGYA